MRNPFTSKRVTDVAPPAEQPTAFDQVGGWAPPEAGRNLDPTESEREQRLSGATALAQLEAQRLERRKAEMDAQLRGVERGRKYG